MSFGRLLRKWLFVTPFRGKLATIIAFISIGAPTVLRLALEGIVVQTGFLPYFPFVVLAALVLDWKAAGLVATVCAILADLLFVGPRYGLLEDGSAVFGFMLFLASSALVIAIVRAVWIAFRDLVGPTSDGGVIFSLKDGEAWASWPMAGFHLRLGPEEAVAFMMSDFLAQRELAKRLAVAANELTSQAEPRS